MVMAKLIIMKYYFSHQEIFLEKQLTYYKYFA